MRKNLLALSIAAMVGGLSGVANAQVAVFENTLTTNTDAAGFVGAFPANAPAATGLAPTTTGIGHILVVPYFTTQGNYKSLLNIVNTDQVNAKAVKLRYRGASNSDDVFDITVYLSPGDVWAAEVAAENGYSRLLTDDNSCTLPSKAEIKAAQNGRFKVNRVKGSSPDQTREGYIEILNSADIRPGTALYNAIKHNADGVAPCTAAVMDAQAIPLSTVSPNTPRERGYSWPTGGLMANWLNVDVEKGNAFSGEAVALRGSVNVGGVNLIDVETSGNVVWFPQTTDNVSQADAATLSADPLLAQGHLRAAMYDFPDLSTPYTSAAGGLPAVQASILAAQLQTLSVTNEYLTTQTSGGFATDWVFSMPTRRYAVAMNYAAGDAIVYNGAVNAHFGAGNVTKNTKSQICVDLGTQRGFDREERSKNTFVISPAEALSFCGEVSVLTFNGDQTSQVSDVYGAQIAVQRIQTSFADGWFTINTPGRTGVGLPIVGYAAAKSGYKSLGATWLHRTKPR